jgi:hypothetical protein
MNKLKQLLSKLTSLFTSGKAQAAFDQAIALVPKAIPIVTTIAALTPNRTDDEIAQAFAKYAQPFSAEYLNAPKEMRGRLLLQLASSVLAAEVPSAATRILDTAVQLAVTGAL